MPFQIHDLVFLHLQDILEIKNFRVPLEYRRMGIGSQLYNETERYAKERGFRKIQIDTHEDNFNLIKFLLNNGFKIILKEYLYNLYQIEAVMQKDL
mgnify:CR=1 FL=1